MRMRQPLLTTLLFLSALSSVAQTTIGTGAFGFSNGVHPTLTCILEGTDARFVESWWKDELKRISMEVSNKKELIGAAALVPNVSPDTVRIMVKAEQRKGSPMLTLHVAMLTTAGWVGPDSDQRALEGGKAFVRDRCTQLRRQLAQQELTDAERALARLNNELNGLQREKERAESGITRSKQRGQEALADEEKLSQEVADKEKALEKLRAETGPAPTEADAKLIADQEKQLGKSRDKLRRAQDEQRDMVKRAQELAWDVKKNEEDQGRKRTEIERQEQLVKQLREKLEAIH